RNRREAAQNKRGAILERFNNLDANTKSRVRAIYEQTSGEQRRALARLDPDQVRRLVSTNSEIASRVLELPPGVLKKAGDLDREEVRERLAERVKVNEEFAKKGYRARDIVADRLKAARERYEDARERFIETRERYQEMRERFNEARETVLACKDNPEAEECDEAADISKRYVNQTISYTMDSLKKLESYIDSSEDISDEEAEELTEDVAEVLAELEELKEELASADTFSEVQEIALEVRDVADEGRTELKRASGLLSANKVRSVVAQTDALQKRLLVMLDNLEERNISTSSLESMIDEFNTHIELALEQYELAKDELSNMSASPPGTIGEIARTSNEYMREAKEHLREARQKLSEIFREVRELQREAGLTDEELEKDDLDDDHEIEVEVEESEEEDDSEEEESEDDDDSDEELNETEADN
ncbi:MAG: hypothetical protein ACOC32_02675, partial [Nanoarchaeota archaeon]